MSEQLRILIDGGSGAGKTTLATAWRDELAERLGEPVQLVHLDDCYPGWQGLEAASRMVWQTMLRPGRPGYWRWSWSENRVTEWIDIHPTMPLLVEGCGSLTRESAPLATLRVWMQLDEPERKRRALARDAGAFDTHWDEWASQERVHWERNYPWRLADLLIDRLVKLPNLSSYLM